jgi:hypothetical protein
LSQWLVLPFASATPSGVDRYRHAAFRPKLAGAPGGGSRVS